MLIADGERLSPDLLRCAIICLPIDSLSGVDVCHLVQPFCDVVSSEDTSGPLTGMAINALDKLLLFGLISEQIQHTSSPLVISLSLSPHADPSLMSAADGIKMVADAITHARFVGTSSASDEVVLMRILKVTASVCMYVCVCVYTDFCCCSDFELNTVCACWSIAI